MFLRLVFFSFLFAVLLFITVTAIEPMENQEGTFPGVRRHGSVAFKNERGLVGGLANSIGNTVDGILDNVLGGVAPKSKGGVLGGLLGK